MFLKTKIKNLLSSTKYEVLNKSKINIHFNYLKDYVDLMLITPDNIICIKNFWTFNNYKEEYLQIYLNGANSINLFNQKPFIFIILKRNNFFMLNNLYSVSTSNTNNYVFVLEGETEDRLLLNLSNLLYKNSIYFYEPDDSVIMLDRCIK